MIAATQGPLFSMTVRTLFLNDIPMQSRPLLCSLVSLMAALAVGGCSINNAGLAPIGDEGMGGAGGGGSNHPGTGGRVNTGMGGRPRDAGTDSGAVGGCDGGTSGTGSAAAGGRGSAAGGRVAAVGGRGGGTGGRGGAPDTDGMGVGSGLPMCAPDLKDKSACAPGSDGCWKTCGVNNRATKPCSCVAGLWNCGDCVYPPGDYSCYDLSGSAFVAPCPPETHSGMVSCAVLCSLCSGYVDSTGAPKIGYCACDTGPDGSRTYQCASSSEWPPQR